MLTQAELRDRSRGPTASTVAGMLNLNPYSSPLMTWLEARGEARDPSNDEALRIGTKLEPIIVSEYEHVTGRSVLHQPPRFAVVVDGIHVTAAADGMTEADGGKVGLECKAHVLGAATDYGEPGTDEVPAHEWVQCQIGMYASKIKRWDLAAFVDNRTRIYRIDYDAERAESLVQRAVAWWKRHVVAEVRPAAAGREREHETIGHMFSDAVWHDKAVLRPATEAEAAMVAALKEAKLAHKASEAQLEALVQELKLAIGKGDGLETPIGSITWRYNRDGKKVDYQSALTAYQNRVQLAASALIANAAECFGTDYIEESEGGELLKSLAEAVRDVGLQAYTTVTRGARPFNTDRKWK